MSIHSKQIREVQDDSRVGNNAPVGTVYIRVGDDAHQALIYPHAFSNPNLAIARQLIAMGQLIEELALNPSTRRQS
jgi:hypothetical protein